MANNNNNGGGAQSQMDTLIQMNELIQLLQKNPQMGITDLFQHPDRGKIDGDIIEGSLGARVAAEIDRPEGKRWYLGEGEAPAFAEHSEAWEEAIRDLVQKVVLNPSDSLVTDPNVKHNKDIYNILTSLANEKEEGLIGILKRLLPGGETGYKRKGWRMSRDAINRGGYERTGWGRRHPKNIED